MKKIFSTFALFCLTSMANAYVFTGGELGSEILSGDLTDGSNYYSFTEDRVSWITYPMACSGTATQQTVVPPAANWSWVGFGDYTYNGVAYTSPTELLISRTFQYNQQTVFVYRDANAVVNVTLGTNDTTDEFLTYKTATMTVKMNATGTINFVRAANAVQTSFKVIWGNAPDFRQGTVNFGSLETGAFDSLSSTSSVKISGGTFNAYTKKFSASKNFTIGAANVKFIVPEATLSDTPFVTVGEIFENGGINSPIVIDFSNTVVDDGIYNLISAGSLVGFDTEDTSTDFSIVGLDGKNWTLDWLNPDSAPLLQLTVTSVPEPATIAAIFGVMALAVAAYRRRK